MGGGVLKQERSLIPVVFHVGGLSSWHFVTEWSLTLVVFIIIIITDRFYVMLFSALEQTHYAHVKCNSE